MDETVFITQLQRLLRYYNYEFGYIHSIYFRIKTRVTVYGLHYSVLAMSQIIILLLKMKRTRGFYDLTKMWKRSASIIQLSLWKKFTWKQVVRTIIINFIIVWNTQKLIKSLGRNPMYIICVLCLFFFFFYNFTRSYIICSYTEWLKTIFGLSVAHKGIHIKKIKK